MDALLLLGIIPGTSFQIDFDDWVRGMIVLLGLLLCWLVFRNRYRIELIVFFMSLRWRRITATTQLVA